MKNQIYIPKKLKVGYQKRSDTYTKKLAYVIYFDEKGKLRKETSWNGWIDKKQGVDDFDNVPTEGFVLNRNVGGVKNSYGSWSSDIRIEKVRVYDPRGFEFEIDVPNVLAILQECTSTKGKGLEGTFVYGWNGPNLVLIPTESQDYREAQTYTEIQGQSIDIKTLIPGASYKTKKLKDLVYLGRFEWFEEKYSRKSEKNEFNVSKKHIFADLTPENWWDNDDDEDEDENLTEDDFDTKKEYQEHLKSIEENKKWREEEKAEAIERGEDVKFITLGSTSTLAQCNSDTPVDNYADLMDRFSKTKMASMPVEFIETKATPKAETKTDRYGDIENKDDKLYYLKTNDVYYGVRIDADTTYDNRTNKYKFVGFSLNIDNKYSFVDGKFQREYVRNDSFADRIEDKVYTKEQIEDMGLVGLNVKLTNNKIAKLEKYLNEY